MDYHYRFSRKNIITSTLDFTNNDKYNVVISPMKGMNGPSMSCKRFLQSGLVLIPAFALLLSLTACRPATKAQLDELQADVLALQKSLEIYLDNTYSPTPVRSAEDFEWNGIPEVWFLLPTQVSPDYLIVSNTLSAMCQTNGWTYERKEVGPGAGTALSLLKAAIAGGDVGAIVFTELSEYMAPFVQQAADEGIIVLCMNPEAPASIAGSIAEPYEKIARETIALMDFWCQERDYLPQENQYLPVAVSLHGATSAKEPHPAALLDALDINNLFYKCRIGIACSEGDTVFNAAYLWARTVMENEPDTRLFCCYAPEAAYGVCYYLEQYAADHELDLADFCVVWNGEDADSQTYLTVAREDDSYTAARGYVTAEDDAWTTGAMLACELLGIAHGTELPASLDETYAFPAENGVTVPESFGGWLWGEKALGGITVCASFAEKDDLIFAKVNTPMTEVVNLLVSAEDTEEAE